MRSSSVAMGGMPGGKHYMGWWGDMGGPKQKGITQYSLSSFQQKAFKGALRGYLFNGFARIMGKLPYAGPPFALAYGVYYWSSNKYAYYNSKEGHHAMLQAEGGGH